MALIVADRGLLADVRSDVDGLNRQIRAATAEQGRLDAVLRKPENAEVLERSVFLNALLYRKGISWTRIFADLEKTVPYNVKVLAIRPSVNSQNQVMLDMTVGADSPEPVIQLYRAWRSLRCSARLWSTAACRPRSRTRSIAIGLR